MTGVLALLAVLSALGGFICDPPLPRTDAAAAGNPRVAAPPRDAAQVPRHGHRLAGPARRLVLLQQRREARRAGCAGVRAAAPLAVGQVLHRRVVREPDRQAAGLGVGPRLPALRRPQPARRNAQRPGRARAAQRRRAQPCAGRQPAAVCMVRAGRHRRRSCSGAGAMSDAGVLNVVLFLPLARRRPAAGVARGAPRLHAPPDAGGDGRAARAHGLALHALQCQRARPAVRDAHPLDRKLGRELPDRPGRLQHPARHDDGVPRAAGHRRRLQRDHEGREAVLRDGLPDPVRDDGRLRRPGPVPVLRVLGNDADPDVPDDRHLGRRAAHLRDDQVLPLHGLRQHPDARRADLPRLLAADDERRDLLRLRRPDEGASAAGRAVAGCWLPSR